MRRGQAWMMSGVLAGVVVGGLVGVGGALDISEAALVTQLEFTGGAVTGSGKQEQAIERLFNHDGTIDLGSYQSWGEIGGAGKGGHPFSLLTSNVLGAPAPTATINGMSITVDLSSLFLAQQRGGELRLWNIGGQATGLYNPDTSEFSLSWKNLGTSLQSDRGGRYGHHSGHDGGWGHKDGWKHMSGWGDTGSWGDSRSGNGTGGTFFLQGKILDGTPAPVAIPAAVYLYSTGLLGLGSWSWLKRRRQAQMAASVSAA